MVITERIQHYVQRLSASLQVEVLGFVEYLLAKTEREVVRQEERAWSNLSLSFAMRGIEDEDTPAVKGASMLTSIQGVYRGGKIELAEQPINVADDTRVIVTFLAPGPIDLRARGIDEALAAELRARLATFVEDWDSPEMSIYDNYEAVKPSV